MTLLKQQTVLWMSRTDLTVLIQVRAGLKKYRCDLSGAAHTVSVSSAGLGLLQVGD